MSVLLKNLAENSKLADNAASTSAAVAKKTEPMGGMSSMLSSQQPGKDASGENGEKWSPASSPKKPAAGVALYLIYLI